MPGRSIPSLLCVAALVFAGGMFAGCQIPNPGIEPTPATLNFPIALALSAPQSGGSPSRFLLVANANYDARYNQGTILSLDMDAIMPLFESVRVNGRFPQNGHSGCTNPASWDNLAVECQVAEAVDVMSPGDGPGAPHNEV